MTDADSRADPVEALRRIAADPCVYLSDMDDLTCADGEWDEPCPTCIARAALAALPASVEIPEFPGGMTDQGSDTDVIRENALGDSGPGFGFRQQRRILRLCDEVDRLRAALAALPAPEVCHICGEPRNAPGSTVCSAAHADPLVPVAEFCPTCGAHESRSAPVPEGVPEDHRVCSHGIYHHGCPSCDRQDPEDR